MTPVTAAITATFNALADALAAHTRDEIPLSATALALWLLIQRTEHAIHE